MADRELDKLAAYMVHIATVDDFRTLKHKVCQLRISGALDLIFGIGLANGCSPLAT